MKHFEVIVASDGLHFTFKLCPISYASLKTALPEHYGIQLAKILDFPQEIIHRAEDIARHVRFHPMTGASEETRVVRGIGDVDARAANDLGQKLLCLAVSADEMATERLREEVKQLQCHLSSGSHSPFRRRTP